MEKYPRISIVTPSYNQGRFLEETILSVIGQQYADLEYIVIDGGSTDESLEIIRKYEKYLAYWVSEKDRGQAHGLNKGFQKATGDIFAYINADDKYCPWAFKTAAAIFFDCPEVKWIVSLWQLHWNANGDPTPGSAIPGYTKKSFYDGRTLGNSKRFLGWIQQESTFWKKSLWEKAGGFVDESLHYAMDFELWSRFFEHEHLYGVSVPLGGFRQHPSQKTSDGLRFYYKEAENVLKKYHAQSDHMGNSSISGKLKGLLRSSHDGRSVSEKARNLGFDYNLNKWKPFELSHPLLAE
jgi:glycosyltransferase involved in cell wall biosynthesis